jgi:hypothetical protein
MMVRRQGMNKKGIDGTDLPFTEVSTPTMVLGMRRCDVHRHLSPSYPAAYILPSGPHSTAPLYKVLSRVPILLGKVKVIRDTECQNHMTLTHHLISKGLVCFS